ncbi:MAG: electron transfer flavoprotein subunit alpha, partial [Dehalococcoidia bacterium]
MTTQKDSEMPNLDEYRDVWVLAEQRDGKIRVETLELLGKGRELAGDLDSQLVAVLLGNNVGDQCQELISYGADKVIWIDDPRLEHYQTSIYTDAVTQQI